MPQTLHRQGAKWDGSAPAMPLGQYCGSGTEGVLIPDAEDSIDQIAVVYDRGDAPPEITIRQVSRRVQAVLADGVAVAVVARATGPALTVDDVLLVERFVRRPG